ncbi:MAG: riboflavin synthase [Planctomycetota bacterium]
MFTGLIWHTGRLLSATSIDAGRRLSIEAPGLLADPPPQRGESIAINGCCLTLVEHDGNALAFDAVPQTLANTTLGGLAAGDHLHLERSCTPRTLLGGHIVQGHVDGVGEIVRVRTDGEWRARIRPPAPLMEFVVPRGSIAVDGVSLTVAELSPAEGWFEIALIPETLERTNLGRLNAGGLVNLECDCMAKALIHWQKHYSRDPGDRADNHSR